MQQLHHYFIVDDDIDLEFLEGAKEMFDKIFLNEAEDGHLPLASQALDEFEVSVSVHTQIFFNLCQ